jgi:hypothetical protein
MRERQGDFVSASEIARLAYCERQVAFDAMLGRRTTPEQRRARWRGRRAHEEFFCEGQRRALSGGRAGQDGVELAARPRVSNSLFGVMRAARALARSAWSALLALATAAAALFAG